MFCFIFFKHRNSTKPLHPVVFSFLLPTYSLIFFPQAHYPTQERCTAVGSRVESTRSPPQRGRGGGRASNLTASRRRTGPAARRRGSPGSGRGSPPARRRCTRGSPGSMPAAARPGFWVSHLWRWGGRGETGEGGRPFCFCFFSDMGRVWIASFTVLVSTYRLRLDKTPAHECSHAIISTNTNKK